MQAISTEAEYAKRFCNLPGANGARSVAARPETEATESTFRKGVSAIGEILPR